MACSSVLRRRIPLTPAAAAVLVLGLPATAGAQITRLANNEPEIRLRADGRTGACDVLRFTPDGKFLLAAGEDKVVHRWAVDAGGLQRGKPLFWNTFREQRGSIYALALSPDGRVAAGGFGKLTADVGVFDPPSGELVGACSTQLCQKGDPYLDAQAAVWALAFRPDGQELAIGDAAGNVWVCPLVQGKPVSGQARRAVRGHPEVSYGSRVLWVGYLPGGRLAYAKRDGTVSEVVGGRERTLFEWKMEGSPLVDQVVASGDGRWLAARPTHEPKAGATVKMRNLVNDAVRDVSLPFGHYPDEIALDHTGERLAVGLSISPAWQAGGKKPFAVELPGEVVIYGVNARTGNWEKTASVAVPTRPDRIAFHPDGTRLATADALDHGTTLWVIEKGQLRPIDRAVSAARSLWAVGMTADGRYLCFKDRRDPDPQHPNRRGDPNADWLTFDLGAEQPPGWFPLGPARQHTRGWVAPREPVKPLETLGGWKVGFAENGDEYSWFVVDPVTGRRKLLPLDPLRQDRPRCYTFLPAGDGAPPEVARLAVGHYWGVSVFELVPGQQPRRIRLFAGHAGYVTAVAPAYGGKGLVTCGRDQVIAVWNLADFPSEPILGAAFAAVDGKVRVTAVDPGSPADEAGLSKGDEVLEFKRGDSTEPRPPATWLRDFRDPEPAREMLWTINRAGLAKTVDNRAKTVVLHRPAARFVPFADDQWVIYTYRQCYYDCSARGDRYIEWLRSRDRADLSPDVLPVGQFRNALERPNEVTRVVTRLEREPAKPLLVELFPPTVTLKVDAPEVKAGQDVRVTVTVTPQARPDGQTVNKVDRVELWLNGHHRVGLDPLDGRAYEAGVPFDVTFTVKGDDLRFGPNTLKAVGIGHDDANNGGSGDGVSEPLLVTAQGRKPARRLFAVVAGIRFYDQLPAKELPGATRDAGQMRDLWEEVRKTGGFAADPGAEVVLLRNDRVTKQNLFGAIRRLGAAAGPDDVLVLSLAGHGFDLPRDVDWATGRGAGPPNWYYITSHLTETTPVTHKNINAVWREAFVSDEELAGELLKLRCQTLVLLDCCHAGTAGGTVGNLAARNTIRGFAPHGFGPVVVAACAPNEVALERDAGGLFSYHVRHALREGFADADTNADRGLTVPEFFRAVRAGTEQEAARLRRGAMTPQLTPSPRELRDFLLAVRPPEHPKR